MRNYLGRWLVASLIPLLGLLGQLSLRVEYPEIEENAKPRHHFMSSYEQGAAGGGLLAACLFGSHSPSHTSCQ
eukprot:jgi/Mesen1/3708/ME000202S02796